MLRRLFLILLSFTLSGLNLVYADSAFTNRADVQAFISMMVKKHQFNRTDLTQLFDQVKYHEIVIKHVNQPLEANPWRTYQRLFVNEWRIKNGVKYWEKHAAALKKAEEIYGVSPSIIVATLGVETKYGERTGEYRVIDSLTSLGFSQSKRAPFFRQQLAEFLLLTREQHLNPMKVTGSYAGAIGMPQFIPSSYRNYAASFTKSTMIDLMKDHNDVIASIANYYKQNGWVRNEPVAVQAIFNRAQFTKMPVSKNPKQKLTLKMLEEHGVYPKEPIRDSALTAKIITLSSARSTEYWIGFHNFDVIKRYNPNDLYAMAVFQLSEDIKDLKERK